MGDKGETVKNSLGTRSCFPHQRIHTTVSLNYFADTETPSRWEKITINDGMPPTSMETSDQLDLNVDDADSNSAHHQPIRRMSTSWSLPLWTIATKFLTIFPKREHMILRVWVFCVPLCWKGNKAILFYFTPNSVSKIQVGTSVQRSWAFSITTWVKLEDIVLSEISQSKKDKYNIISLIWGI